jgi:hypothetical protein
MTLTELADRVGMTLANLSVLKTGKARAIRFSTLDAICNIGPHASKWRPTWTGPARAARRSPRSRPCTGGEAGGGPPQRNGFTARTVP